jgi:hypothetical protein
LRGNDFEKKNVLLKRQLTLSDVPEAQFLGSREAK